jgi:hypothetical protein
VQQRGSPRFRPDIADDRFDADVEPLSELVGRVG